MIGVGNTFRRDDGAGIAVTRAARPLMPPGVEVIELDGEPARLVEAWDGAAATFVVDAVRTGAPAGTLHRIDANVGRLPRWAPVGGTHALGISTAVDLARALDRLPSHLIVYGVEGAAFEDGSSLTPDVADAVPHTATRLADEVDALLAGAAATGGR